MAGEQIGPYVLLGQVDAPDGPVWKAQEAATGLVVALRLLPGDASGTTYVVQNWLTGANLGTVTAGTAASAGGAAGAGAGTAASAGGAVGAGAGTGTGTAASAGGAAGAGAGTAASAGRHPAAGGKGVLGHIAAHKALATIAAVVVAGGIAGVGLVAVAGDDEPVRRTVSSTTPTTDRSAAPTTTGPTTSAPSASAPPTLSEDESAAAEIEGRYTATPAGGTIGGIPIPAGLGGAIALRVVSDCGGGPCTVRVTDGNESLNGTGTYDDGSWSGSGNYAEAESGCTAAFEMTLTPSGRNLTLRFVSGDFCGFGAADLQWKMTPTG